MELRRDSQSNDPRCLLLTETLHGEEFPVSGLGLTKAGLGIDGRVERNRSLN
jgi:hypothetical protein